MVIVVSNIINHNYYDWRDCLDGFCPFEVCVGVSHKTNTVQPRREPLELRKYKPLTGSYSYVRQCTSTEKNTTYEGLIKDSYNPLNLNQI